MQGVCLLSTNVMDDRYKKSIGRLASVADVIKPR